MHVKVKGTKETASGLGSESRNIGTGIQEGTASSSCDNKVE